MAILKKIIVVATCLTLCGCYEDFNPETDTRPVLCLNALLTAGEPMDISVTRTWMFTDESGRRNHQVDDAQPTVYVNGLISDTDYIPQPGDHFRLKAYSPTYGTAEAEVTVPYGVTPGNATWEVTNSDVWTTEAPNHEMQTNIKFNLRARMTVNDPGHSEDFYQFTFAPFHDDRPASEDVLLFSPGTFVYEAEPIFSEHIGMFDAVSGNDSYGFSFFTDRRFNGDSYTLNIQFNSMLYCVSSPLLDEKLLDCGIELILYTVSPSYYNWCNYQWNIQNGTIGDLGDIGLGDPVWGYSNVSSGAGVVAARTSAVTRIELHQFLENKITQ